MAGAEQLVRAYFAALGEIQVKADLSAARILPRYVLAACELCRQFDTDEVTDALRAAKVHGRASGGQFSLIDLSLQIIPQYPGRASGSVRYTYSVATLVNPKGQVVAQGPPGPLATYLLSLAYSGGQWRIFYLQAA